MVFRMPLSENKCVLTYQLWDKRKNLPKRIDHIVLPKPRKMANLSPLFDESSKVFRTGTQYSWAWVW